MPYRPHEVQYEQCSWKKAHVLALYPRLRGVVIADGQWHEFPFVATSFGRYRVVEEKYFQALFSTRALSELDEYLVIEPAATNDDAEWLIWRVDPDDVKEGYVITSKFAVTPGPFGHHQAMLNWLERHELGLEPNPYHVQGLAYFGTLGSADLTDAIEHLSWLEMAMGDVNEQLQECSRGAWRVFEQASDGVAAVFKGPDDEVIPVPPIWGKRTGKKRIPMLDE